MFRAGATYEQVGDRDQALTWIGRALIGGYSRHEVERDPSLKALRADPRFAAAVKAATSP